jgi:hypothetical protein
MILSQGIEELTELQKHIGPEAEVRFWSLSDSHGEALAIYQTTGITAGWDKHAQKPTAVITGKPCQNA